MLTYHISWSLVTTFTLLNHDIAELYCCGINDNNADDNAADDKTKEQQLHEQQKLQQCKTIPWYMPNSMWVIFLFCLLFPQPKKTLLAYLKKLLCVCVVKKEAENCSNKKKNKTTTGRHKMLFRNYSGNC